MTSPKTLLMSLFAACIIAVPALSSELHLMLSLNLNGTSNVGEHTIYLNTPTLGVLTITQANQITGTWTKTHNPPETLKEFIRWYNVPLGEYVLYVAYNGDAGGRAACVFRGYALLGDTAQLVFYRNITYGTFFEIGRFTVSAGAGLSDPSSISDLALGYPWNRFRVPGLF